MTWIWIPIVVVVIALVALTMRPPRHPYHCRYCGMGFRMPSDRLDHIFTFHVKDGKVTPPT